MCTIIAAVALWPERPLVIAANRDEFLSRPASEPRVWEAGEWARRRVLAPRDLRAGGTWLGVNDAGVFVGITNRRAPPDPNRRSRGELVLEALAAADHRQARAAIAGLDARAYNPFHLLMADRGGAAVVWSDGETLHELELAPGIHWITERSFGAGASERHATLDRWAAELAPMPSAPTLATWTTVLSDHRSRTSSLDGVCVHADALDYGTRSSTVLELGDGPGELRFFHAVGRPCATPLIELEDAPARLFGA
jgi:uncharacterized protein with NRDE domain